MTSPSMLSTFLLLSTSALPLTFPAPVGTSLPSVQTSYVAGPRPEEISTLMSAIQKDEQCIEALLPAPASSNPAPPSPPHAYSLHLHRSNQEVTLSRMTIFILKYAASTSLFKLQSSFRMHRLPCPRCRPRLPCVSLERRISRGCCLISRKHLLCRP